MSCLVQHRQLIFDSDMSWVLHCDVIAHIFNSKILLCWPLASQYAISNTLSGSRMPYFSHSGREVLVFWLHTLVLKGSLYHIKTTWPQDARPSNIEVKTVLVTTMQCQHVHPNSYCFHSNFQSQEITLHSADWDKRTDSGNIWRWFFGLNYRTVGLAEVFAVSALQLINGRAAVEMWSEY